MADLPFYPCGHSFPATGTRRARPAACPTCWPDGLIASTRLPARRPRRWVGWERREIAVFRARIGDMWRRRDNGDTR